LSISFLKPHGIQIIIYASIGVSLCKCGMDMDWEEEVVEEEYDIGWWRRICGGAWRKKLRNILTVFIEGLSIFCNLQRISCTKEWWM